MPTLAQVLDVEQILKTVMPTTTEEINREAVGPALVLPAQILVADDSQVARSVIELGLKAMGVSYIMTKSGKEAWDTLQKIAADASSEGKTAHDKIAMVLTDLEMPEMDGFTDPQHQFDPVRRHSRGDPQLDGNHQREPRQERGGRRLCGQVQPTRIGIHYPQRAAGRRQLGFQASVLNLECRTRQIELATGHVVQRAQVVRLPFKMPAPTAEDAWVGVGGGDFPNEQVVGGLVVRLGDDLAHQPAHAAPYARRVASSWRKQLHAKALQFVRHVHCTVRADGQRKRRHRLAGHIQHEETTDSTSARVRVALSITTVTLGGLKSSGHDHAAAMTLA